MKIFYLCDRRACEKCNAHCGGEAECKHTTDVRHAVNFEMKGESIWETEPEVIECTSDLIADATLDAESLSAAATEIGRACAEGIRRGLGI